MYYDVINFHHEKCWNNGDQFGFFFYFLLRMLIFTQVPIKKVCNKLNTVSVFIHRCSL